MDGLFMSVWQKRDERDRSDINPCYIIVIIILLCRYRYIHYLFVGFLFITVHEHLIPDQ